MPKPVIIHFPNMDKKVLINTAHITDVVLTGNKLTIHFLHDSDREVIAIAPDNAADVLDLIARNMAE